MWPVASPLQQPSVPTRSRSCVLGHIADVHENEMPHEHVVLF
jgi:hypothetical protein